MAPFLLKKKTNKRNKEKVVIGLQEWPIRFYSHAIFASILDTAFAKNHICFYISDRFYGHIPLFTRTSFNTVVFLLKLNNCLPVKFTSVMIKHIRFIEGANEGFFSNNDQV